MRKTAMLCAVLLAAALLLTGAALAVADTPSIVGNYHGKWTCTPPGCEKPGGSMDGNIQASGSKYGGTFHLKNTTVGDITGTLDATLTGNQFNGIISNSQGTISFNATVNGNHIHGTFDGPLGKGSFDLDKN